MPRFVNIPGGVEDTQTGKNWKLGQDVNRNHAAAVSEVAAMSGYNMPTQDDLNILNSATVAEMNACNLSTFVGDRIWAETKCQVGRKTGFSSIDLGNEEGDDCTLGSSSTDYRAMGID